ncbi:MAG: bifunctional riboflavin kinase/FAD synthetase [Saprospiraceae bacterium]|nr:bifunctional riboflavin kinase/FAD synthetase [Saprospiraceae bacterium]
MNIYRNISELPLFKKAVITIGSFDGVHKGHQKILERIKTLANEINGQSVVITFHPHPRRIIFPKDGSLQLLSTLDEKLELLRKNGIENVLVVPFTVEFSQMVPAEYVENFIIKRFNPAYIVIGYDHRFGLNRGGDINLLKSYENSHNFKVIEIPRQEIEEISISSTKIRIALNEGNIAEANRFLNHPYVIAGKVIHGDKLGSKIGYPTANLLINSNEKLIPKDGVYACRVNIYGDYFEGMLYIGTRPTLGENGMKTIEINIFEFRQDIYDQFISIEIFEYLRDDLRFEDLNDLKVQLALDEKNAKISLSKQLQSISEPAKVTIAVLNYNGLEFLESFLPMMMYSSRKFTVDIMVIDNHSTDESVEYIEEWHPEIKVVQLSKNYGFAGGYNNGLGNVASDYIVFMNSDVLVKENWLDPIIEKMEKDKAVGACQPQILSLENRNEFEYAGAAGGYMDVLGYPFCRGRIFDKLETNHGQYDDNAEIFWASGAAMVTRTRLFNKFGKFDQTYFAHHEEIDFCWRLKRAGYKILCIGESQVFHLGGGTLAYENPRKTYLNFRNNIITILKNESFETILWSFPIRLILDGLAGIKFILQGKFSSTIAIVKAHWNIFSNFGQIMKSKSDTDQIVHKNRVDYPNQKGKYKGLIIWDYFVKGKRNFSSLKIHSGYKTI